MPKSNTSRCPCGFKQDANGMCQYDVFYTNVPFGQGGLKRALSPSQKTLDPQRIELGKWLFFDPILSESKNQSCAHCHHPDNGFSDGKKTSPGQKRSAPSLWNTAFLPNYFWDGRAKTLEEQALQPIISKNEMS